MSSTRGRVREMRAAVLDRPGSEPRIESLLLDPPGPGEVRVRMLASGVCHSDLHMVDGEWGDAAPLVLGHEGCGVIAEVGADVAEGRVGERVVLDWFAACGSCPPCRLGRPWTCDQTRSLDNVLPDGSTRLHRTDGSDVFPYLGIGTFGVESIVPAGVAIQVPGEVPAEVAALIGCCVTTGVSAVLRAARVGEGDPTVVFGLGGVGLSVVMGLVLAGASPIVAVDRVASKLALAEQLGATGVVRADDASATIKAVRRATGGGAAFAFEAIGLSSTIEQAVASLAPGGTAVLVGMTPMGVRASVDAFRVVDRSLTILGTNYGFGVPSVDFPRYASWYLQGRLPIERLIDQRISLDEVTAAFDAMRRGEGVRRVIVHEPG